MTTVLERRKLFRRKKSNRKQVFVRGRHTCHLQLTFTDPEDPSKRIPFPAGIRVRLLDNGRALPNRGSVAETDAEGKVELTPDSATAAGAPAYHFRIDHEERIHVDLGTKKRVPAGSIKPRDTRDLVELPMRAGTLEKGFHYIANVPEKLKRHGKIENYDRGADGPIGTPDKPVVLELRLYWFPLDFRYFDAVRNERRDVPRGLTVLPVVREGGKEKDFFSRCLTPFDEVKKRTASGTDRHRWIQYYLNLLGYKSGAVDGIVGPVTRDAIRRFQKAFGLKVDGIAGPVTRRTLENRFHRPGVGVYRSGSYRVAVWKRHQVPIEDLYFEIPRPVKRIVADEREFARFDLFLFTRDKGASPKLMTRREIADAESKSLDDARPFEVPFRALPFRKARCYYDLPAEWSSRNYWTRKHNAFDRGADFRTFMKNELKLYPFVPDENRRADRAAPLVFSLDDIVLLDRGGKQTVTDRDESDAAIPLKADSAAGKRDGSRLSLFYVKDGELVLHAPEDPRQPFFSKVNASSGNFSRNLITNVPGNALAIVFANDVYTVFHERACPSPAEEAGGQLRGCRAARIDDPSGHYGEALCDQATHLAHNRYYAKGTGNFEWHYLHHGCPIDGPDGLEHRAFLLFYWNGRFRSAPAPHAVSAAKVRDYETEGMKNARDRWEKKGYTLEPVSGDCRIQIKPVFFFEAKAPGVGGRHKCTVTISDNPDDGEMGYTRSKMYWKDCRPRDYLHVGTFVDIDGMRFDTLVVSHELGHAQGKDDDYCYEEGELNMASDGVFSQYYPGMPYRNDLGSIMWTCRAPRMRHLSCVMNWINDGASQAGRLKPFLNGARFRIVHRYGTGQKLLYELPSTPRDCRDICRPVFSKRNRSCGTGNVDLFLYKLGDDETPRNISLPSMPPEKTFHGILVVFIKVGFRFVDSAGSHWTPAEKRLWRANVRRLLKAMNRRFYLRSETDRDFKNTYLSFFPLCLDKAGAYGHHAHYRVEVTKKDPDRIRAASASHLIVGRNAPANLVASYILGKNQIPSDPQPKPLPAGAGTGKNDLDFVRDWLRSVLGDPAVDLRGA